MYQLKELLKDLGVEYTPELIAELGTRYYVVKKGALDPLEQIAEYVCVCNGVNMAQLLSKKRTQANVNARRDFVWVLHNFGYKIITAAGFLKCHHSTVLHHIEDLKDKFRVRPIERSYMIDKYKGLLKSTLYTETMAEMESKYPYKHRYYPKCNLERF